MKPVVWQPRSSAVDLACVVETEVGSTRGVVPDGRCGVAVVDGVPWWFGPHTTPWAPSRPGVHVVGVRLALTAGRRAAGGSLRQWQDVRFDRHDAAFGAVGRLVLIDPRSRRSYVGRFAGGFSRRR